MDIFRLAGDSCHGFAIFFLISFMIGCKSCCGISGKSQLLFFLVYTTRYLDLLFNFVSVYNTIIKIHYISLTAATAVTIFCIFIFYRKTYQWKDDTFLTEILIVPSMILAVTINHENTPTKILWTFSIYLEALAIIPQFYMILKTKMLTKHVLIYLVALGLYRTFYIPNWIYRYLSEGHYDEIADSAGIAYVLIYLFGAVAMFCIGVKMMDFSKNMLQKNIFFISSTTMPADRLNGDYDQLVEEKTSVKADIEK
ncbi:unnamed protein product [Phaedon cochleariae]|uniref:ER lumen protein-retaining receptor n=1 Tax=Phaedon cochleariae TaxID=80249 RepID=A0A9N9X3U2_PHACE|nr:unnamed protein product [Phaedon cochleariae]